MKNEKFEHSTFERAALNLEREAIEHLNKRTFEREALNLERKAIEHLNAKQLNI